jgi:hypothetical protein
MFNRLGLQLHLIIGATECGDSRLPITPLVPGTRGHGVNIFIQRGDDFLSQRSWRMWKE